MSALTAVLAGATGLVGGECMKRLLAARRYGRIVVVTRRPLAPGSRHRNLESVVTDFDRLDEVAARLGGDHVFCALGTTIRKAGSQARFRVVDHDYPLRLARITRQQGARHFSVVSALGASRTSPFFYSRVKGEMEEGLRQMGWPSLAILRPSVIAGYPSQPDERLLLSHLQREHPITRLTPVVEATRLNELQRTIWDVYVDESLKDYNVKLVSATRDHPDLVLGASPRASLALFKTAQALAAIRGRDHVIPDDIQLLVPVVLTHRLLLAPEA